MSLETMTPTQDTRDRVMKLEAKVEQLEKTIDGMSTKVTEMHELLIQAKGARWLLFALVAIGSFMAAKITPLITYFFSK
jgi:CHAD domain-containing protein